MINFSSIKAIDVYSLRNTVYLFLLAMFFSCSNTKESKDRAQLVADLPYRSLSVSDSLQDEIMNDVSGIVSKLETTHLKMFYRKKKSTWLEKEGTWNEVEELRLSSFEEWKPGEIDATMIIFPSTIKDHRLSRFTHVIGVEYEHSSLTGTCFIIVNKATRKPVSFDYLERN